MRPCRCALPSPFCPGGSPPKNGNGNNFQPGRTRLKAKIEGFFCGRKSWKLNYTVFARRMMGARLLFFGSSEIFPPDCTSHFKGFIIINIIIIFIIGAGGGGGLKLQTNASTHNRIVNALCYSNITNYTFCGLLSVAPWWALPQINENFSIPPPRPVGVCLCLSWRCVGLVFGVGCLPGWISHCSNGSNKVGQSFENLTN